MAIGAVATFRCPPGREAELTALLAEVRAQVRREAGNVYYDIYRSRTDPAEFVVMERYRDREAVRAHGASADTRRFAEALRALLDEDMAVRIYEGLDDD
jgi:quinol monooxygenase YgiN